MTESELNHLAAIITLKVLERLLHVDQGRDPNAILSELRAEVKQTKPIDSQKLNPQTYDSKGITDIG